MPTLYAHPAVYALATEDNPPSPTLTNPDMILPYRGSNSSPMLASSPTIHDDGPAAIPPLGMNGLSAHPVESEAEIGIAKAVAMPYRMRQKPSTPTMINPIYHSFYEHGAPLSDIGEEETTPKSKKRRSTSPSIATSPTRPASLALRHKNRLSITSSSSTGSDLGNWEDFDSSKIMNGRLAADVARTQDVATDDDGSDSKRNSGVKTEDEMTSLNQKAERILASAKKRLTHMEDNLSKARNSVLGVPKLAADNGEYHQPVGGLYRSISQGADRRLGPGPLFRKSKPLYPIIQTARTGHGRVMSETSVPSGSERLSTTPENRSTSAMEYGRSHGSSSNDSPPNKYPVPSPSSIKSNNSPLQILQEDEDSTRSTNKTLPEAALTRGLGITSTNPENDYNRQAHSASANGLVRSSSQASTRSTRDLREQMSDLKSKIADLRTRAQADHLRRTSRNSLRTPSPYAQSPEQFYTGAPEYREGGAPINANAGLGWSPQHEIGPSFGSPVSSRSLRSLKDSAYGDGEVLTPATAHQTEVRTDVNTPNLHKTTYHVEATNGNNSSLIQESQYEDAPEELAEDDDPVSTSQEEQIYLNEVLEESLQEEPDVPLVPGAFLSSQMTAERHEDRYDAFDYENMFLHSALGNYSHSSVHSRSDSGSSVATKRAAVSTPPGDEDEFEEEEEDEDDYDDNDDGGEEEEEDDDDDDSGSQTDPEADDEESGEEQLIHQQLEARAGISTEGESEEEEPATPRALLPPAAPWMRNGRSNSLDSVSTVETFATATEGDHKTEEESDTVPTAVRNWPSARSTPVSQLNSAGLVHQAWAKSTAMSNQRPPSRGKQLGAANGKKSPPQSPLQQVQRQQQPPSQNHQQLLLQQQQELQEQIQLQQQQEQQYRQQRQRQRQQQQQETQYQLEQERQQQQQQQPPPAPQNHPANTEILMASLITLAHPTFQMPSGPKTFENVDKDLVIALLRSVGAACSNILTSDARGHVSQSHMWRRRLDAARAVIEGSLLIGHPTQQSHSLGG